MNHRRSREPGSTLRRVVETIRVRESMKKVLAATTTALLVASAVVIGVAAPASATVDCVPQDAWTETIIDQAYVPAVTHTEYQRYSWTKPQNQDADNPQTTPPGPDWQANTTNYEGAGHGTDPIGVAFDTGHPGNGNWFFWTATEVVDTPAIEEVSHTVDHPAVTCDPPPTPACISADVDWHNDDYSDVSWEIHLGQQIATRNTAATINPADFGGIQSIVGFDSSLGNGDNIYVHYPEDVGATNTYTFNDGTVVVATVSEGTEVCAPVISWVTTVPVIETTHAVLPTVSAGIEECVDGQSQDANGSVTLAPFVGGHWELDGNTVSGTVSDLAPGAYAFKAIADDGYTMVGKTWFTMTVPESTDVDCIVPLPERPTWSDPCGVDNGAWTVPADGDGITWSVVDHTTLNGKVGIVATLTTPGMTFPSGATFKQWTAIQDNTLCEVEDDRTIILVAPAAVDPTCEPADPQGDFFGPTKETSGYIELDLKDHLHYSIDGVPTSSAKNDVAPGEHTITVLVDDGYTLVGQASWTLTVNEALCDLPTHALLSTSASMSNNTCDTGGSYTLADTAGVQWFVNGSSTPTAAGTYQVSGATTVNVEAQLIDTVNDGWEFDAQTAWTFGFTDPEDCLETLAFTGTESPVFGGLLASGFLLVGGVLLSWRSRARRSAV